MSGFWKTVYTTWHKNPFFKVLQIKQEIKDAQGGEQITDTSSDSSDEGSTNTL